MIHLLSNAFWSLSISNLKDLMIRSCPAEPFAMPLSTSHFPLLEQFPQNLFIWLFTFIGSEILPHVEMEALYYCFVTLGTNCTIATSWFHGLIDHFSIANTIYYHVLLVHHLHFRYWKLAPCDQVITDYGGCSWASFPTRTMGIRSVLTAPFLPNLISN